jgi:hypothetical protein
MFYSSSKYDSLMDWVFSFGGIITIALIGLAIWLIYNYFQKRKNDNDNSNIYQKPNYYPQNKSKIYDNQYDTEFASDDSLWDELSKNKTMQGSTIYPTREEEPIPPNAIPPSPYFEEEPFEELKVEEKSEYVKRSDGLYEKEVTKQVVEDDLLFDDIKKDEIPIDEPVIIEKKENK